MRAPKLIGGAMLVLVGATAYGYFEFARPPSEVVLSALGEETTAPRNEKTLEERIQDSKTRSRAIKGLYMTGAVANDQGRAATTLRERIVRLIETTEANGVVIDVKETSGGEVTKHLKPFLDELRQKNIWTIARIATFRDNSQVAAHPEYYLKRSDGGIWRDNKGNAWMDPMNPGARLYLLQFARDMIGLGFDELQFDYIRFPSDGNVRGIVYPTYDQKVMTKYAAMRDFFSFLHDDLKAEKPEIIISADLFGYVSIERNDMGIGQRLEDIGNSFDIISPMLYPSHFYSGFYVPADQARNLPALSLPYRGPVLSSLVSARPYDVIYRSLLMAEDILAGRDPSATSSLPVLTAEQRDAMPRLRPWLQDFDLGADTSRGIYYDSRAVRAQIDAAEHAGAAGWLLWSPTNTYTESALKPEN